MQKLHLTFHASARYDGVHRCETGAPLVLVVQTAILLMLTFLNIRLLVALAHAPGQLSCVLLLVRTGHFVVDHRLDLHQIVGQNLVHVSLSDHVAHSCVKREEARHLLQLVGVVARIVPRGSVDWLVAHSSACCSRRLL